MHYQSRIFWRPKDLEIPQAYEDAYSVGDNGIVAIADGVSSAIFSRQWANILTRKVADGPPDPDNSEVWLAWLAEARAEWAKEVGSLPLGWSQRAKLRDVGGAYSTLLWIEEQQGHCDDDKAADIHRIRCFAVGDCCLFHLRDSSLLCRFPLETVADFAADPITLGSAPRGQDPSIAFQQLEVDAREDDFIVLATDALARWIYQRLEAELPVPWNEFWEMSQEDWYAKVDELRNQSGEMRMRVDDTTLIMLRLASHLAADEQPPESDADDPAAILQNLSPVDTELSQTNDVPTFMLVADHDIAFDHAMDRETLKGDQILTSPTGSEDSPDSEVPCDNEV